MYLKVKRLNLKWRRVLVFCRGGYW